MAENPVKTIVLMGPPRAGTTTLLATLPHAWPKNAHGFPAGRRYALDETGGGRELSRLAASFAANPSVSPQDIESYSADLIATEPARPSRRASLRLIDIPGSRLLDLYGPGAAPNEREAFEALLAEARALVLVWPMAGAPGDKGQTLAWAKTFLLLAEAIRRGAFGGFDAILAAFSRYDIAVAPAGPLAARDALDPARVRAAIRSRLSRDDAFRSALLELAAGESPVEAMPVSAHGLIEGYCQANWMEALAPGAAANGLAFLFGAPGTGGGLGRELANLWTPLFALDPFVRAAFGERHGLMFSMETIAGDRRAAGPRTAGRRSP